jgi:hypothetical protein|tara:strand:- start:338 stop:793 length:456 start_codon:yes stop_codon:yes gene_type:complete
MENFSEYLPKIALSISILTFVISGYFSWRSNKQGERDQKLNQEQFRTIKEDTAKANFLAINPSWFAEVMKKQESWWGLVTHAGHIIPIKKINVVSDDGKWLEVTLLTGDELTNNQLDYPKDVRYVALDENRATASVQTAHITMAYEIWEAP